MTDTPHFAVPFTFNTPTGEALTHEQAWDDNIVDQVKVVLAFPLGSREDLPAFGRPDMLFRETTERIDQQLADAIAAWVPDADATVEEVLQTIDEFKRQLRVNIATRGTNA